MPVKRNPKHVENAELAELRRQRDTLAETNARLAKEYRQVLDLTAAQADAVTVATLRADSLEADNVRQANRIRQMEAGLVKLATHGTRWPFIPAGQVKAAAQQILRGEA